MEQKKKPVAYSEYLGLNDLLNLQKPESGKTADGLNDPTKAAHDETLFIIIHQVYELWFKQILHELDSVRHFFQKPELRDEDLGNCVSRLERITRIQKIMIDQVDVLESMTPLDFLDFRDVLFPASGFQSAQFRLVENKLGLRPQDRLAFEHQSYMARLSPSDFKIVDQSEKEDSLFTLVERWLERTPFLQMDNFSFWSEYKKTVESMLGRDEAAIQNNPMLNAEAKTKQLEQLQKTKLSFESILHEEKLKELISKKEWRLSQKATLASLFISLYREQPLLQLPHKLLSLICDIDENFTLWRYRHALMALRMIGTKIGTGGSSGAEYLQKSTQLHRVFHDFTKLATFLVPRKTLPELPREIRQRLAFSYAVESGKV